MHAVAIVLRGSYVNPVYLAIELWKLDRFAHAGILLSDGRIVESSAKANKVVVHSHPCEVYNYETLLDLSHLGLAAQERIAYLALSMQGWKYDWRAAKSQVIDPFTCYWEEDSQRVICFEHVVLSTKEFLHFPHPLALCDSTDIISSWKDSK